LFTAAAVTVALVVASSATVTVLLLGVLEEVASFASAHGSDNFSLDLLLFARFGNFDLFGLVGSGLLDDFSFTATSVFALSLVFAFVAAEAVLVLVLDKGASLAVAFAKLDDFVRLL